MQYQISVSHGFLVIVNGSATTSRRATFAQNCASDPEQVKARRLRDSERFNGLVRCTRLDAPPRARARERRKVMLSMRLPAR